VCNGEGLIRQSLLSHNDESARTAVNEIWITLACTDVLDDRQF
jgi:hypothetical protein